MVGGIVKSGWWTLPFWLVRFQKWLLETAVLVGEKGCVGLSVLAECFSQTPDVITYATHLSPSILSHAAPHRLICDRIVFKTLHRQTTLPYRQATRTVPMKLLSPSRRYTSYRLKVSSIFRLDCTYFPDRCCCSVIIALFKNTSRGEFFTYSII